MNIEKKLYIVEQILKTTDIPSYTLRADVSALRDALSDELADSLARKRGTVSVLRTAKNIIKTAYSPRFQGVYKKDEYTYVTDTYRMMRTTEQLDGLPGVEVLSAPEKIVETVINKSDIHISIPALNELKSMLKTARFRAGSPREVTYVIKIDDDLCVNINFLIDGVTCTGANEIKRQASPNSPIYMSSDTTTYILFPIVTPDPHNVGDIFPV